MPNNETPRPRHEPSPEAKPFWEGLDERRLLLQHCADCGRVRHYPRPVCDACHSMRATWRQASGRGVVHSWTVAHHAFHPAFQTELPYIIAAVDLDEGVRMLAPLRHTNPDDLRIGLPVLLTFEERGDGTMLPAFVSVGERGFNR